jgi:hypothetical protein
MRRGESFRCLTFELRGTAAVCRLGREAEDKPGEPRGPGGMPRWVHSSEGLGSVWVTERASGAGGRDRVGEFSSGYAANAVRATVPSTRSRGTTRAAMVFRRVAAAVPVRLWPELTQRPKVAAATPSAALCAAFNLLTLKRAWLDGSRWFNFMARCAA